MKIPLRPAFPEDAGHIAAIYGEYVLHGLATFEEIPPDAEEMARRMVQVKAQSYPGLAAGRADRLSAMPVCPVSRNAAPVVSRLRIQSMSPLPAGQSPAEAVRTGRPDDAAVPI